MHIITTKGRHSFTSHRCPYFGGGWLFVKYTCGRIESKLHTRNFAFCNTYIYFLQPGILVHKTTRGI